MAEEGVVGARLGSDGVSEKEAQKVQMEEVCVGSRE